MSTLPNCSGADMSTLPKLWRGALCQNGGAHMNTLPNRSVADMSTLPIRYGVDTSTLPKWWCGYEYSAEIVVR